MSLLADFVISLSLLGQVIKELINFPILIFGPPIHSNHMILLSLLLMVTMKQQKFMGNPVGFQAFSPLFFEKKVIIFSFIYYLFIYIIIL